MFKYDMKDWKQAGIGVYRSEHYPRGPSDAVTHIQAGDLAFSLCSPPAITDEEHLRLTRLVEAAPELLETLRKAECGLAYACDRNETTMSTMADAIAWDALKAARSAISKAEVQP